MTTKRKGKPGRPRIPLRNQYAMRVAFALLPSQAQALRKLLVATGAKNNSVLLRDIVIGKLRDEGLLGE